MTSTSSYKMGGILSVLHAENASSANVQSKEKFVKNQKIAYIPHQVEQVLFIEESSEPKKKRKAVSSFESKEAVKKASNVEDDDNDIDGDDDNDGFFHELMGQSRLHSETEDSRAATGPSKTYRKPSEDQERLERTLFVGNLSTDLSRKDVRKLFKKCGDIETVRIRSVPLADPKMLRKVAFIKKEFHPERRTMNAYVVFKEASSIKAALSNNGMEVAGFHIRVDACSPHRGKKHDHKRSLFVGNLPFGANEEDVRAHFASCGHVVDVRLIRDKATSIGKGFGYVKFKTCESVLLGLKLNGSTFNGRQLRVFRSSENSGKPRAGKNHSFAGLRASSGKGRPKAPKRGGTSGKSSNALRRIKHKNREKGDRKNSKGKGKPNRTT